MVTHLEYSCLGDPMERGAWWTTVHGVTKSWSRLELLSIHAYTHTHTHTYSDCSLESPG